MIWTKYNHLFKSEKFGWLLYNSLTNSFLEVDDNYAEQLKHLKENPLLHSTMDAEFISVLKAMSVIFNGNGNDIFNILKMNHQFDQFDKTNRTLTIIPTLDCNFSCAYCFEKDTIRNTYMEEKVEEKLLEFISNEYENDTKLNHLGITWFGGEPLLAYDKICSLTEVMISKNLPFDAQIITNGYLLTDEIIHNLTNLKINNVQITIDGDEKTHNERRPHKTENNSYAKIIENLKKLDDYNKILENKLTLSIRLNIDKTNKELYFETATFLSNTFSTVSVYPGITQGEKDVSSCSSNCFNFKDQAEFFISQYEKYNNSNLGFYPDWFGGVAICAANRFHDYVIGPEGEMYTCWNEVGKKEMITGNILNGYVNKSLVSKFISGIEPIDTAKCRACFYLPICGGGCPNDQVLKKYFDKDIDTCCKFKGKKTLEKLLEIHYEIKQRNEVLSTCE